MPLLSVQRVRYPFEEQVRVLWSIVLSEICRNINVHFERVILNTCNLTLEEARLQILRIRLTLEEAR